ncbi:hypothetical protein AAFF_G00384390 [Aldrovandia affinis]|uniref:Bucky ball n=1 Tax=Aldrovandia affinis TaxID=143900 RepID=A0AAD7WLW5_9TELE|nr:hypothetical protein AAFF_G00384390 [Aldrovandia affinis]
MDTTWVRRHYVNEKAGETCIALHIGCTVLRIHLISLSRSHLSVLRCIVSRASYVCIQKRKMEDTGIPTHSMGNGQSHQNPVNHTRPFFYVQPPSQPLYYYQWQMSNPYGQYGAFPGQGVPYGRPYMAPYPYMSYPGYIMPHAPMQPIDYRRMYNPHPPSGAAYDVRFQHQHRAHRETACSETQTEPSDSVGKLVSKLDGLRAARQEELVRQDAWTVGPDGVLPLDSSSRHEESDGGAADELVHFPTPEKLHPTSEQLDCPGSDREENCGNQHTGQPGALQASDGISAQGAEPVDAMPEPPPANHQAEEDLEQSGGNVLPPPDVASLSDVPEEPILDVEQLPYRILRLPCNELTTAGLLQTDGPPWRVDTLPPAGYLPSLGNGYLYSYYPSVAPERQSVLSPSLDELSSRDDMFSTDLEDVDSVSGRAYTGGRAHSLAASEVSDPEEGGDTWDRPFPEAEHPAKMCATCGSSLNGDARRSKAGGIGLRAYLEDTDEEVVEGDDDDYGDEDEILKNTCETQEAPARHPHHPARHPHFPARYLQPPCARQSSQQKPKKVYSSEPLDPADLEVQSSDYPAGTECCEGHKALAKPDHCKGQDARSTQPRPRMDKQWGGGGLPTGQESWEIYDSKPRPWKSWRPYPSMRGQERAGRRRGACKTFVSQRPRRRDYEEEEEEEEEFLRFQRGRGSTKRRGARY